MLRARRVRFDFLRFPPGVLRTCMGSNNFLFLSFNLAANAAAAVVAALAAALLFLVLNNFLSIVLSLTFR